MSRPLVACAMRLPIWPGTGSTRSTLQSLRPTAASEKRPVSGGVSVARATFSVDERSGPYQGFSRPPFTALRVVATRTVGRSARAEASKRGAVAAKLAQPASEIAALDD